jgi:protocadherin-16/23
LSLKKYKKQTNQCLFFHIIGSRGSVKYSIYSGDPDGYFTIDQTSGNIRVANTLDHETKPQILLNIQATSGDPPAYGHTQV